MLCNSSFYLLSIHATDLFSLSDGGWGWGGLPFTNPNLKIAESSAAPLLLLLILTPLILHVPISQRGEKLRWFTAASSRSSGVRRLPAICLSSQRRSADTPVPSLRGAHPTAVFFLWGIGQVQLRCVADKGCGRAVEATVMTAIHSAAPPPKAKTLPTAIQQLCCCLL